MTSHKPVVGIVGGSGYIGFNISKILHEYSVKIIDINSPQNHLNKNIEFIHCDVTDLRSVKEAITNIDVVIHTAIIQIPQITQNKKLAYEVNVLGTQNVCKAVSESNCKGMILSSSWHTIGEREIIGLVNEEFGYRPDKVEGRAKLYAISKMMQEGILKFYDNLSNKFFGIIRMGTVLGEGMPEKTAANIFINNGLQGKTITPFKHSMYRPMLYVDISDICTAYKNYIQLIINNDISKNEDGFSPIFNVFSPEPITIFDLAKYVQSSIQKVSDGRICPKIEIIEKTEPMLFTEEDKFKLTIDISNALKLLKSDSIKRPETSIDDIVKYKYLTTLIS